MSCVSGGFSGPAHRGRWLYGTLKAAPATGSRFSEAMHREAEIAIQEQLDGKAADWMGKVSDEQYQR